MTNLLQIHEPGETPLPHAGRKALGIDLGTTHSVAAVAAEGRVEVLRDAGGRALLPSVVHYGARTEAGWDARARYAAGDANAIASIKRRMHDAATKITVAGRELTPVEISAEILRAVKAMAEAALGEEVKDAVITVPAYFDDTARAATRHAAQLAGLNALRLINEPTAAALAYGLDTGAEGIYAIYDLGGGTFDISLLKLEKGVFQVLATGGDTQLGGDDFDRLLAEHWQLGAGGEALSHAREIKEALSTHEEAASPRGSAARDDDASITRAEFESLIAPLVDRTITVCERALRDAKLTKAQINGVVLVGGSTRIPLVQKRVAECFGRPPLTDINPDEVVAYGAALQAEGLMGRAANLLLDVIPLSLGLETMGGLTEKLIQRNTPIPTSVTQEFTTYQDGQTGMKIHVVQGEREMVADNRSLARFELAGIPPLPAGIARVAVTFTVDADGLLTVSAQEQTTGARQQVEVRPSYGLPEEEVERMLRESMERARSDITERLLVEARVEAERSLVELESAMKQDAALLTESELKLLNSQISYVREAASGDDRERIDVEMHELARLAQAFAQRRMDRAVGKALQGKSLKDIELKNHA